MKTKIIKSKGYIELVLDEPVEGIMFDKGVIAGMTQFADLNCWILCDIRLGRNINCSPYTASIAADDYFCHLIPEDDAQRQHILSYLKEYQEHNDGTITWCSYNKMVRGLSTIDGYSPSSHLHFYPEVYHSRKNALALLIQIQEYWNNYSGTLADSKIENPYLQKTASEILMDIRVRTMIKERQLHHDVMAP